MKTDMTKDIYEKPEIDVLDIQVEGSILTNSQNGPEFDIDPDQTGEWD